MSGDSVDNRCCGTGTVLYYDDGYVGDNRTKKHPKEVVKKNDVPVVCFQCTKPIDQSWAVCPFCGTRLKDAVQPVVVKTWDGANDPR